MAVTSVANENQTAVITTEHTLFTSSAAGVYVYIVDCGLPTDGTPHMSNGDVLELRIYSIVNGGTEHLAYYAVYAHSQAHPVKYSVPVPTPTAGDTLKFTLKQTVGTGRIFPYRVVTVG